MNPPLETKLCPFCSCEYAFDADHCPLCETANVNMDLEQTLEQLHEQAVEARSRLTRARYLP
jgi:hypothetical protein